MIDPPLPPFPVSLPLLGAASPSPSLRDDFAGKALQGLLGEHSDEDDETLAEWAYDLADAMLVARDLTVEGEISDGDDDQDESAPPPPLRWWTPLVIVIGLALAALSFIVAIASNLFGPTAP